MEYLTFIIFTAGAAAAARFYGLASFPVLFLASCGFYLCILPAALSGVDAVTGAEAAAGPTFYAAALTYALFYLLGVRVAAPLAFKRRTAPFIPHQRAWFARSYFKAGLLCLLVISLAFILFSLVTRNIFTLGGSFLFTILGFDLLVVYYFAGRHTRSGITNAFLLGSILALLVFAGFRYRIVVLLLTEIALLGKGRRTIVVRLLSTATVGVLLFALAAFGQVRLYGTTSFTALADMKFEPAQWILASGEQTVAISTVAVVEKIDSFQRIWFEPIWLLATHYIPSAIFPGKPRATYLGAFLNVTEGLRDTGTAMHDVAQASLMFGTFGLPFSALLLGVVMGAILQATLRRSPNLHFATAAIILFAVFIPTRGYLPQQMTWALTFLLPAVMLCFMSRFKRQPRFTWLER